MPPPPLPSSTQHILEVYDIHYNIHDFIVYARVSSMLIYC